MKLKLRTKQALIRRTEGIISVLLVVLLVPFYSVAAILAEVGRFQGAYRGLDSAISASEVSVLAQYDSYIKQRFGLLAISQDIDIGSQFRSYLKKQDTINSRSFTLKDYQITADGVYSLADTDILREQILELAAYTVPAKIIADLGDINNIVSQIESYSTGLNNFMNLLSGVSTGLDKGMQSYNAQKEAKDQMQTVVDSTKKYHEEYENYEKALTELKDHLSTACPTDEAEAQKWNDKAQELRKKASDAGNAYKNVIQTEKGNVSGLAGKIDSALSKEADATDSLLDITKGYVSAGVKNENADIDEAKKETDEIINNAEISKDVGYAASDMKDTNKLVGDLYGKTIDNAKVGSNTKDALKDYNSEACKDLLQQLEDESKLLDDMNYDDLTTDGIDKIMGAIHTADTGKFEDTKSFDELWKNAQDLVENEAADASFMDTLDGLIALINVDVTYDPELDSIIDTDYYFKNFNRLPSEKNRSLKENSLASEYEDADAQKATNNLNKMGLYSTSGDWYTKGSDSYNAALAQEELNASNGNLFQKLQNLVKGIQKKLSSLNNMLTALSEVGSRMGEGLLLKGYMAYSLSNRVNYKSGASLVGQSYSSCGGLAKIDDKSEAGQMLEKRLDDYTLGLASSLGAMGRKNYSFCGAELEYVMFGAKNEINNQKAAFTVLAMLNSLLSLPAILSSSFVQTCTNSMVAVCAALPPLSAAMTVIVPAVFTLANGTIDAILLVNGSKAPIVKTNDDLNVTPAGIVKAINKLTTVVGADSKTMAALKKANSKINKNSSSTADTSTADNSAAAAAGSGGSSGTGGSSGGSSDKPLVSGSKYWDSVRSWDYTGWMTAIAILIWQDEDGMLNRFVDIIQMEQTNRMESGDNTNYTLEEQISGKKKKFDVDKAYTTVRANVSGKFVNVLPVPTMSKNSAWSVERTIYRGY